MYNEVYLKAKQFADGQTKSINHTTVGMILSSPGYLHNPVDVTEAFCLLYGLPLRNTHLHL
jgi:hypothetical protein